jgi:cold shock CspA family protein
MENLYIKGDEVFVAKSGNGFVIKTNRGGDAFLHVEDILEAQSRREAKEGGEWLIRILSSYAHSISAEEFERTRGDRVDLDGLLRERVTPVLQRLYRAAESISLIESEISRIADANTLEERLRKELLGVLAVTAYDVGGNIAKAIKSLKSK